MKMTDKEKSERKEIRKEIKARRIVIKKLDTALRALERIAKREQFERQTEREKLMEYKTYNEAQEAYGWGQITEEEFNEIVKFLDDMEEYLNIRTANDLAIKIIRSFRSVLSGEIDGIKFDLLPKKEQEKIIARNKEILERRLQYAERI